jgi:hypothetical protein
MNCTKNYGCESRYIFIALEKNKYIVQNCMYTVHTYIYTLQIHMLTNGIVIHYIGCLLFVFLTLQPIVVVFSQPGSGL